MSEQFSSKHIIRGTAVTSLYTILSRILGFFRDLIVAHVFGAGVIADAYFVAFRIPNLLRSFVAEGALSAAFVPIFSEDLKKSKDTAQCTFSIVATFLTLVTITITILCVIFTEQIISWIAPGFNSTDKELCILLTRIMFPYIIFVSLIALFNGALTSLRSFGAAAAAQSVMNIVLIIGGLISALVDPQRGVIILSISVLLGGVIQVLCQLPVLKKAGLTIQVQFSGAKPVIAELLRLMAPALLGATIYQIIIFSATLFASLLESGSVSWLFYADRIIQLPIGIFSVALASVLLPALSENVSSKNHQSFADNLSNSLRFTSFLLIPLSFFIFLSAADIVSLLFERGAFDAYTSAMTAAAVQALSLGIWFVSCHSLIVRAFMARRDNITPTMIGLIMLLVNILLSLALMGKITSTDDGLLLSFFRSLQELILLLPLPQIALGHVGLALASSCASLIAFFCILTLLSLKDSYNWSAFVRSTIISLAASLVAFMVVKYIPLSSLIISLRLTLQAFVFLLIYLGISAIFQSLECRQFLILAKRKLVQ